MTESDLSLNLAATFGPILKKSFPDASPRWRYAVAGALAESVITRRSWFARPVDETERLRAWPAGLTQALREILGIPNFQCGPMAHAYQKIGEFSGADGLALENRAEDEQAFILHKLLCIWFEHGDDWREPAIDEIDRAAKAARAALQHKGEVSRG